ncbi:MAG: hypothetical protein ACKVTZ_11565 [Bacteroidia bacterium]
MKTFYVIQILLLVLLIACNSKPNTQKINEIARNNDKQQTKQVSFYLIPDDNDTSNISLPFVKLTLRDGDSTYVMDWGKNGQKWQGRLFELTNNRGYRVPPSVIWVNNDYVYLMTNWTGHFSEKLFLPLKKTLNIHFFDTDRNVEYADSLDSFVVYLEENDDSKKVKWTIQSLVKNRKESFVMPIYEGASGYPWFSSIKRKGDLIWIEPQGKTNVIIKKNIKKYCL